MRVVVGLALGLLAGVGALVLLRGVLASPVLVRENHRGHRLPTAAGVVAVVAVVAVEAGWTVVDGPEVARLLAVLVVVGFALLGLVDDLLGSGADGRGFAGHLRALARGRLTTGGLKLLGGAALAVVVAGAVDGDRPLRVLVDAAVIALAANLANLFDRAPGRVLKVGAVGAVVLGVASGLDPALAGVAVAVGALVALVRGDLAERFMLGDTGANALGAVLGLGIVLTAPPAGRAVAVVALLALNLASEVVSFSSVIDRTPPLRWVDRAGRARR